MARLARWRSPTIDGDGDLDVFGAGLRLSAAAERSAAVWPTSRRPGWSCRRPSGDGRRSWPAISTTMGAPICSCCGTAARGCIQVSGRIQPIDVERRDRPGLLPLGAAGGIRRRRSRRRPDLVLGGAADASTARARRSTTACGTTATAPSPTSPGRGRRRRRRRSVAIVPTDFDNRRDVDLLIVQSRSAAGAVPEPARRHVSRRRGRRSGCRQRRGGDTPSLAAGDVNKDGCHGLLLRRRERRRSSPLSDGRGRFAASTGARRRDAAPRRAAGRLRQRRAARPVRCTGAAARLRPQPRRGWADVTRRRGACSVARADAATSPRRSRPATSTATATPTSSCSRLAAALCGSGATSGATATGRERRSWPGRVSNRARHRREGRDAGGQSAAASRDVSAATPPVAPADITFGLGVADAADVVRVLWPSGILQAETVATAAAPRVTPLAHHRARSQALVVPLPLHLERRAVRVRDRLPGRRRDGYLAGPGRAQHPDPDEYVRIRGDQLAAARRPVRDARDERAGGGAVLDRLAAAWPSTIPRRRGLSERGHDASRRSRFGCSRPGDRSRRAARLTITATMSRERIARSIGVRGRLRGCSHPRLCRDAHADARPRDVRPRERAGAAAHRLDRLRVLERQRRRHQAGWTLDAARRSRCEDGSGRWRTVVADIGIPVGRPQTIAVDLAGRLRRPRAANPHRRPPCASTGTRSLVGRPAGTVREPRPPRPDRRARPLRWRGFSAEVTSGRPRALRLRLRARVAADAPWKLMPGPLHARRRRARLLVTAADDMFVIVATRRRDRAVVRRVAVPPLRAGWTRTFLLHARRLQQGDGHQLRQPGHGRSRCRSTA